jgi:hypothetical protein
MEKENNGHAEGGEIRIDYDHISVADIMAQIRERVARQPEEPEPGPDAAGGEGYGPPLYTPEPQGQGAKSRIKGLVLKLMRPFSPLIKFLVLPVHQQVVETQQVLDQTNRRLDFLYERQIPEIRRSIGLIEMNLDNIHGQLSDRIDEANTVIQKLREYSKLLHNLSHNIVVEMTKLKIEEENNKLKSRILEKDFVFLQKKEKVLEEELFK